MKKDKRCYLTICNLKKTITAFIADACGFFKNRDLFERMFDVNVPLRKRNLNTVFTEFFFNAITQVAFDPLNPKTML